MIPWPKKEDSRYKNTTGHLFSPKYVFYNEIDKSSSTFLIVMEDYSHTSSLYGFLLIHLSKTYLGVIFQNMICLSAVGKKK